MQEQASYEQDNTRTNSVVLLPPLLFWVLQSLKPNTDCLYWEEHVTHSCELNLSKTLLFSCLSPQFSQWLILFSYIECIFCMLPQILAETNSRPQWVTTVKVLKTSSSESKIDKEIKIYHKWTPAEITKSRITYQNQISELSGRKYKIFTFNIFKEMKEEFENTRNKPEKTIKQIWKRTKNYS